MEKFKVEIDRKEIVEIINASIQEKIKKSLELKNEDIEKSIEEYFDKGFFKNKNSTFDAALDYTIEIALRQGLEKAMEELDFKEVIAKKAKEMLSDSDFISDLAEAKVRASLGLPSKQTNLKDE